MHARDGGAASHSVQVAVASRSNTSRTSGTKRNIKCPSFQSFSACRRPTEEKHSRRRPCKASSYFFTRNQRSFLTCFLNSSNTNPIAQKTPTLLHALEIFNINQNKSQGEITSTFFAFRPAFQQTAFMKITSGGGGGVTHNCADKERN